MAVLSQERHVELVSGASEAFVITSLLVSAVIPTELPHRNVFVITVNDIDDPKQDSLARVARISDLSLVPIGRDAGIASPVIEGVLYLSASTTNIYTTLEVANDAAVAFQDRVNTLIVAWILYRTQFSAPDPGPALYTLPRSAAPQKTALVTAYKLAKQSRYQFQQAQTAADTVLSRAQSVFEGASSIASDMGAIATAASLNKTEMNGVFNGLVNIISQGNGFLAAATVTPPSASDKTVFQNALTSAGTLQYAAVGFVTDAASLATLISNYQTARVANTAAAAAALTAAQSDQITKAQQLASAQVLEAAALAAVLAVCPDFDKRSVALVDDTGP